MSTPIVDLDGNNFRRYTAIMVSPEQSRAARGWLDWSQEELAKRANVSLSTVRDFEKGRRTPIGNNLDAMRRAFEAEGVELGDPQGITVKKKRARKSL
jgi:ribosome-binding protein aMBF1 (putative translation factor)